MQPVLAQKWYHPRAERDPRGHLACSKPAQRPVSANLSKGDQTVPHQTVLTSSFQLCQWPLSSEVTIVVWGFSHTHTHVGKTAHEPRIRCHGPQSVPLCPVLLIFVHQLVYTIQSSGTQEKTMIIFSSPASRNTAIDTVCVCCLSMKAFMTASLPLPGSRWNTGGKIYRITTLTMLDLL